MPDSFITDFLKHIAEHCSAIRACGKCPYYDPTDYGECFFFDLPSTWKIEEITAAYYNDIRKEQENESPKN